jgi:hypothetical protein
MDSSQKIPPQFREHLEDLQAIGRACAKILSIYSEDGKSYLRTDNGLNIPLERVEEAGGMRPRNLA